jgi:hypothetical protein
MLTWIKDESDREMLRLVNPEGSKLSRIKKINRIRKNNRITTQTNNALEDNKKLAVQVPRTENNILASPCHFGFLIQKFSVSLLLFCN